MNLLQRVFWFINKFFMAPMFRLGLGFFIANPLTGYIMTLKTKGRKTGKTRYTPVNYAIMDGNVYCMAGFGRRSHWYLNLKANPNIEAILPGRAITVQAEEITDPEEGLRAGKLVIRNSGVAGFMEGYNPFNPPEEKLKKTLEHSPIIRLRPTGIGSGPADPQGWLWITIYIVVILALFLIFR